MLREVSYYSRMTAGLYRYARAPVTENPEDVVRAAVERREANFLDTVRKAIFTGPANPYREMFHLAGCALGDLENSVRRDGLESALAELHRNGVWLDHDEFKGIQPIVRSGKHIPSTSHSFRNPLVTGLVEASSGGSRGSGTRTPRSVEELLTRETHEAFRRREFALSERAQVEVRAILPSTTGLNPCMRAARLGHPVDQWLVPGGSWRSSAHYRVVTYGMVLWARALGVAVPIPKQLAWNDFSAVAGWVAGRRTQGQACVVGTNVSTGVRIARSALDQGLDIRETLFLLHGEALSEAKAAVFVEAGCLGISHYGISEIGTVGSGCRNMANRNCAHLFRDSVAVIGHVRRAPFADVDVNSILLTTLLPSAPHVFINVDMQDSAVIEKANCNCTYARLGFTEQVRDISSFGKLTGFGMTLLGTDLVRFLEEALPRRLGGAAGDCQLVQRESSSGTKLSLHISPRLKLDSLDRAKQCFLDELRPLYGGSLAARTWAHADAIEVIVAEPLSTPAGKVLPLHLIRERAGTAHAS